MKRLISFLCLLLLAFPALAEPYTVGLQTPVYTAAHNLQAHDAASAYAIEPADISGGFTVATWEHTDCPGGATCGQFSAPGVGNEAKARFDCNDAFEANDDPIIAPGVQNGSAHKHRFFGNLGAAAAPYNATYASLRASGNSTCYGGPINRSLYWEPEVFKQLTNGAVVGIIPKNIVTYYEQGSLAAIGSGTIDDPLVGSRWPRGISMIFGFNLSDATDSRITAIVAALNGAGGSYSTVSASTAGGFVGWTCVTPNTGAGSGGAIATSPNPSGPYQPYLRNTNLTATLDCAPNTDLIMELISYPCWDGVNLHSPDGRLHFMPYIRDNALSKFVCPNGWVRVMQFRVKVTFNQTGQSDYTSWYLSSDRMSGMTQYRNGETAHADLIPAWDYGTAASPGVFLTFVAHCDGVTITISGTTIAGDGHECGFARISSSTNLFVNEASPDASSPNPIVTLSPDQRGKKRYAPQSGSAIPGTIHNDTSSMNDNMLMDDTQLAGAALIGFDLRKAGR